MQVRAIRIVRQIYRLLLALYPPVFRREFGGEMEDVFTQLSVEARQRGGRDLALALWGELVDPTRQPSDPILAGDGPKGGNYERFSSAW